MFIEVGPRGNGKTERLLKFAKENETIVVCANPNAMKVKAQDYGIGDIECISYGDLIKVPSQYSHKKIIIDELYTFLFKLNKNLMGFTQGIDL